MHIKSSNKHDKTHLDGMLNKVYLHPENGTKNYHIELSEY